MPNIRKGKGYRWSENNRSLSGERREQHGFTVDNLDTKDLSDARNDYERIFIIVRDILESKSKSLANDEERLQCAQDIADTVYNQRSRK